jgi:catechol-2,3-dioxygenase
MNLRHIKLQTNDLSSVQDFYSHILELPIIYESKTEIIFKIGATNLAFEFSDILNPIYHYAINIPQNQFKLACKWLRERVETIRYEGSDIINFKNWNAHAIYFYDSVGNIVELIARHNLDNISDEIFTVKSLLKISEIGLPTANVPKFKALLNEHLMLQTFVSGGEKFDPLGTENGLFICVILDRKWFPTEVISKAFPVEVILDIDKEIDFEYEVYRIRSSTR